MGVGFAEAVLLLGLLLAAAAALSGWLHRSVLSVSILSVGVGLVLALAGIVSVDPEAEIVVALVELALILTLFSDGLVVEHEMLRRHWHPPARALVIALPTTLALLALAAKLLFSDLSWAEAFLLGAVLSPTDPVVTSSLVASRRVPRVVRHTLNLESGLNDGLALPFVLLFLAASSRNGDASGEVVRLVGETASGAAIGVVLGLVAGRLLPLLPGGGMRLRYEGMYALGVALAAFGLAEFTFGNGLISVFVCGIVLGLTRHEIPDAFGEISEGVSAIFQVATFFVFGALVVATGWSGNTLALVVFIAFALAVARPVGILVAYIGVPLPTAQKLFIAWFGPKGVASMLFALFVLGSSAPDRTIVFDIASLVVLASIVVHGATDNVAIRWLRRRESVPTSDESASPPAA